MFDPEVYARALDARDPRFDGVFFVGITSTRIYCRPVCPARVSYPEHRRFFPSSAAAEQAGFRPCLRCRPELAPGRALVDAVSCLARAAALRIAAGALNGCTVGQLAHELGVGERQLRRAMERELGVAPGELAQTHRLLLAKCLLTDTSLPVTRIAFASGFQSVRRFNSAFRERYRMNPTALRSHRATAVPAVAVTRQPGPGDRSRIAAARRSRGAVRRGTAERAQAVAPDLLRLTLAYRAPLAWDALLAVLDHDSTPGVELVDDRRYARTVRLGDATGVVVVEDAAAGPGEAQPGPRRSHVHVDVSLALVPALMPLLARLRQVLDLDAEPLRIDAQLAASGLGVLVARRRGLRVPGTFDGFELACRKLVRRAAGDAAAAQLAGAIARELGEPLVTGIAGLTTLGPSAEQVSQAGAARLAALGVPRQTAEIITAVARAVAERSLRLEPGSDVDATQRALVELGVDELTAEMLIIRALHWPDGFPAASPALQRTASAMSAAELLDIAERWRPWRAYAAVHLWLHHRSSG